jgi:tetratricopeptide (TPR) repeat protein
MTGREDLYDESMELGHSAAWELDWDRAIQYYRKALAEFPDHPAGLTSLGLALLETGELKESLSLYHRASKASPNDPIPIEKCAEIFERLGQNKDAIERREAAAELYLRRRDVDKALSNWNSVARLAPDNLAARSRLAITYERLGRRREAVHEYLAVAAILQKLGKVDRALEAIQRAVGLIPGEPEATHAMRLLRQGKPLPAPSVPKVVTGPLRAEQVQTYLTTAKAPKEPEGPEPEDPEVEAQRAALSMIAALLFDEGQDESERDHAVARAVLSKTGRLKDTKGGARLEITRSLSQAIDLQTRGHKAKAVKEFERALAAGLDHPAVHYNLGFLMKELDDVEGARKHLMAAVGHPDLALGTNLALGRLARTQGDMREAARHLLQALRFAESLSVDESQSAELNEFYDSILATQKEGDQEGLSRIVESTLDVLSGPAWLQRLRQARQQIALEGTGASIAPIAGILASGGTEGVLGSLSRIDELVKSRHLGSAMEEAMLALHAAPGYLPLHRRMAEILLASGQTDTGVQKMAVIAETHMVRGEAPQATEIYSLMLQHSPVDFDIRQNLIELLKAQNRTEEVLGQYLELAELYRQLAQIDRARGALQEALQFTNSIPSDRKWQAKILRQMADLDLSRLDWRRALRSFEQLTDLDPNDDAAHRQVIDLHLRLGQEERAAQRLDRYLDHLVKKGRGADALAFLEEMAREHPGKQTLHMRLAEAYRAAGRKADAIAQYDALGEIQLDAGQVKEAMRTIQAIIDIGPPDVEGYLELLRNIQANQ